MKTLLRNLIYLFLITGVVFLFSCKKSTENKLEGTWNMIKIHDINDTLNVESWNFTSDGKLNIFRERNGVNDSIPEYVCRYYAKSYRKLVIEPLDANTSLEYCHEWKIAKLRKNVLVITYESGGVLQREFERL
jgi:hypothetical protein